MKTAAHRQTLWTMVPSRTGRPSAPRQNKAHTLINSPAISRHKATPPHHKHEPSRHYIIRTARTPDPSTPARIKSRAGQRAEKVSTATKDQPPPQFRLHVTRSIEAHAPLWKVYDTWTRFEAFPHFMQGINDTHGLLNESRMVWRIRMGVSHVPLEAEVCEQIPYRKIAWKSQDGHPHSNSGAVIFEAINEQITHITAHFDFSHVEDWPGDPIPAVTQCLDWSLQCFCSVVESHVDHECELYACPKSFAVA